MRYLQSSIVIFIAITVFANPAFAQNSKGKKWFGAGYSMSIDNTIPDANSATLSKVRNTKTNIQLTIGKFISDKTLVGFLPSYSLVASKTYRNYSNQNNSTQEMSSSYNHNLGLGVFARQHYKLLNDKIYWWLQPSINYQMGVTNKISSNNDKFQTIKNYTSLNFAAGLTFYLYKNFVLTTTVNIVNGGYDFSKTTNELTNSASPNLPVEKSYTYSSGFSGSFAPNFSLGNTISLNIVF